MSDRSQLQSEEQARENMKWTLPHDDQVMKYRKLTHFRFM